MTNAFSAEQEKWNFLLLTDHEYFVCPIWHIFDDWWEKNISHGKLPQHFGDIGCGTCLLFQRQFIYTGFYLLKSQLSSHNLQLKIFLLVPSANKKYGKQLSHSILMDKYLFLCQSCRGNVVFELHYWQFAPSNISVLYFNYFVFSILLNTAKA